MSASGRIFGVYIHLTVNVLGIFSYSGTHSNT